MSKLTVYIDGSQVTTDCGHVKQGWGILAFHDCGKTIELNGHVAHKKHHNQKYGWHEFLAFYHAVQHAECEGYSPSQVSFYTDCDWLAYSGFHLVPANFSGSKNAVIDRFQLFHTLFILQIHC